MLIPHVNPSDYLRVAVPDRPSDGRGNLAPRLARNIAALFGVHVPGHPAGITWAGDYTQVTLVDIARGAPTAGRGKIFVADDGGIADGFAIAHRAVAELSAPLPKPKATAQAPKKTPLQVNARRIAPLEAISPASLNEYGPDSKASSVLAGANVLFDTLSPTIHDAMELLSTKEEEPVSDLARAMMWAFLIGETLRSQPALFSAAWQARGVQRALTSGIRPAIEDSMSEEATRSEFGTRERSGGTRTITDLNVLDTLSLPSLQERLHIVDENIVKGGAADETMGQSVSAYHLTIARTIRRVVELHFLGDTAVQLKVRESNDGSRTIDGFLRFPPMALTLMQELSLGDLRHPFSPSADVTTPNATWNFSNPEHLKTLLPHVPTSIELRRLPRASQVATLMTAVAMGRALREIKERQPNDEPSAVRSDADFDDLICYELLAPLAKNARDALGEDDPIVVVCQLFAVRTTMVSIYAKNLFPQTEVDRQRLIAAVQEVLGSVERAQDCARSGAIAMAQYTEIWITTSATINEVRRAVERFDSAYASQLYDLMIEQWEWTKEWWEESVVATHNYAGLLVTGENLSHVRIGVDQAIKVLHKRQEADRLRGDVETSGSLRTRYILVRGLGRLVRDRGAQKDATELRQHLAALLRSPLLQDLIHDDSRTLTKRRYEGCYRFLVGYLELRKVGSASPQMTEASMVLRAALNAYLVNDSEMPSGIASVEECWELLQKISSLDGGSDA